MRHSVRLFSLLAATFSTTAMAQGVWTPGSEIVGQSVRVVSANGVTNTVYFDQGGTARIVTPGGREVPASWTAANGNLCVYSAGGQECFPYTQAFMAGQTVSMTSSCGTSAWTANGVNAPPPPPPAAENMGERG